jgi:hypothetical protein
MVLKIPPPPTLPVQFQQLNRWLLEIQSILNTQGTIDPGNVGGLTALFTQVATNTANIATNTANIATNTANIATNTANIVTLTARSQINNGSGAPASGLGNNGDLYINNTGSSGTHLYGKIAGAWVALA